MKTRLTARIRAFAAFLASALSATVDALMPIRLAGSTSRAQKAVEEARLVNTERLFGRDAYLYEASRTFAFLPYKNPSIKKAVWKFKYYLSKPALNMFAEITADEIVAHLTDSAGTLPVRQPALLVYGPSSSFHAGKKKFDQMRELCLHVEKLLPPSLVTICLDAILIAKTTEQQHLGTKADRQAWSKERYALSPAFKERLNRHGERAHIICIDDILTTGATLSAIQGLLSSCGVQNVTSFALCHAELDNKRTA